MPKKLMEGKIISKFSICLETPVEGISHVVCHPLRLLASMLRSSYCGVAGVDAAGD